MLRHIVLVGTLVFPAVVFGTPYWVDYDASSGVFPEDAGWTRYTAGGGAQRWFEDGALVIDSRQSINIGDDYAIFRPGALDPDQDEGEIFVMQWRLRVDALTGPWDPGVGVLSDGQRGVNLDFGQGIIHGFGEGQTIATFDPAFYHDFELRSTSMLFYDLYIDGSLVFTGDFWGPAVSRSVVAWGDVTLGGASLTYWDHMSFGVVPEPCSVWLTLLLGLWTCHTARLRQK